LRIDDLPLPQAVRDFYLQEGFQELYPPQEDAVETGYLQDGRNLLACIPTASGKTLLAEFAMLKSVLSGGKAAYIVPLRALAAEKREHFQSFRSLGVKVGMSTGDYENKGDYLGSNDIIVITSEKMDSLIRNGAGWLSALTVVVADEVHLLDSPNRGPTLEVTLAKLRRLNPRAQVIALSATVGNAVEVADWLDAHCVVSEWRPVELREGVLYGAAIHFADDSDRELEDMGREAAVSLALNTVAEGGQCLLFAGTRRNAEGLAQRTARALRELLDDESRERLYGLSMQTRGESETESGRKLADCLRGGAAFHHAGLLGEHRRLVENAFRSGDVKVVAATPTLAAGLNLPARRVVIRDWQRYEANQGNVPIPVLEYKQMAGRAGRPGLDPYGESVLIAKGDEELEELMNFYVLADVEPIFSKLGTDSAMRSHVLSTIATGFATSMDGLNEVFDSTFYAHQQGDLSDIMDRMLAFLSEEEMVEFRGRKIKATDFGSLVSRLYVDPLSASIMARGLRQGFPATELGVFHLVGSTPDMRHLYLRRGDYSRLVSMAMEREGELWTSPPDQFTSQGEYEEFLGSLKSASVLEMWVQERTDDEIAEEWSVAPGDLRNMADTGEWLVSALSEMCRFFDHPHSTPIRKLAIRLRNGVREDLLPLLELQGVGRVRARALFRAGYTGLAALRRANPRELAGVPAVGPVLARSILKQLGVDAGEIPEKENDNYDRPQRTISDFRRASEIRGDR